MSEKTTKERLYEEPHRFDFFQAVRLLEKIFPERVPLMRGTTPKKEVVRLRGNPSLRFPPSQIKSIEDVYDEVTDEERVEMMINFMGLVGVVGVLPTHYSELIVDRARYNDTAFHGFTDIFTHRAVSLFFGAWEKYRFPVQYERGNDDFTSYLFDFIGLGTKGLRGKMGLDDEGILPYSGLIIQKPHSATAVEQILSDYFGIKAKVRQFFGQWLDLDSESITQLSRTNSVLGESAIVGTRIWDQQSKFRLVLGPMSLVQFQSLLPNGNGHVSLRSLVSFVAAQELDYDVKLVLKAEQVPGAILTTRAKRRPMLGWTSWLKSEPFEKDDDQVVLQIR
ncbi:MAG: type VI secretion system baseplate subunit TssG [Acidobacteria bacterium]|nr:type VI secretion system baseplate subunit TssG [Acidobacteriota bacterium]